MTGTRRPLVNDEQSMLGTQLFGEILGEKVQKGPDLGRQVAMTGIDRPGNPVPLTPAALHPPQATCFEVIADEKVRQLGQANTTSGTFKNGGAVVTGPASANLDLDGALGGIKLPDPRFTGEASVVTQIFDGLGFPVIPEVV